MLLVFDTRNGQCYFSAMLNIVNAIANAIYGKDRRPVILILEDGTIHTFKNLAEFRAHKYLWTGKVHIAFRAEGISGCYQKP